MKKTTFTIISFSIFSLALHLLLGLGVYNIPEQWLQTKDYKKQPIEIEVINDPSKAPQFSRTIVREALIPENYKMPEDEKMARFLSAQKVRVKKEVRAPLTGLTKNTTPKVKKIELPKNSVKEIDQDTASTLARLKEMRQTGGPSTTGESLPVDISIGSFTALNTDQYFAYSFFSRVEELVRYRWEARIRNALDGFHPDFLKQNSHRRNWVSQIEFILAPNGQLIKGLVLKESGIRPFDLAAINAFKEAAFFPNPPKELVQEDGFIHLKYSFNVHSLPSPLTSR